MSRFFVALVATLTCILAIGSIAQAHVVCGNRVFPTTLTMDDPGVGDELSLPTLAFTPTPSGQSNSYGFEWDKSITEDLTFAINGDYITQRSPGQNLAGWDNFTLTLKDQHPCDNAHPHEEFAWSVGLVREILGTGSAQLRNAGAINGAGAGSTSPTFYFGKGFGGLSDPVLRPFAVTGEFSRDISDNPIANPSSWSYAASLQYSLPYLNQNINAIHSPFLAHLTPIVEVVMSSPDSGGTPTGTISPGFLYDSQSWQLGAEAVFPANKTTAQGQGVGFIVQYHVFLDTFYKSWFGKPIIKKNLWGQQ